MRDLPPDENLGRRRRRRRWMDRGMLALVLSAVFLGLVLIVYFLVLPPVVTPAPVAAIGGSRNAGEARQPDRMTGLLPPSAIDVDVVEATSEEPAAAPDAASVASADVPDATRKNTHVSVSSVIKPGDPEVVHIDFIVASVVQSPLFELVEKTERRFRPGSWLQVDVKFTTFPAEIDELTFRYFITFNGDTLARTDLKTLGRRTFSGEIHHAGLQAGAHRSLAYLVPRRTELFLINGKLPSHMLDSVLVQAFIGGKLVTSGSIGNGQADTQKPLEGFVRSVEQTPFQALVDEHYEPPVPPDPPSLPGEKDKKQEKPEKEKRAPDLERVRRFTQTSPSKESPTR